MSDVEHATSRKAAYQRGYRRKRYAEDTIYREKMKAKAKVDRLRYPERVKVGQRDAQLRRCYGITLEEYRKLLAQQNGVCAICKGKGKRALHVDHDHKTMRVRGLLCYPCNNLVGFMESARAEGAFIYLKRSAVR